MKNKAVFKSLAARCCEGFFALDKNDNHFQKLDIAEHFIYNSVTVHGAGKLDKKMPREQQHNSKD